MNDMLDEYPIKRTIQYVGTAGSGKTRAIEEKIKSILEREHDTKILFLTYSRDLVVSSKQRFRESFVDSSKFKESNEEQFEKRVTCQTIHSLCYSLLNTRYPDYYQVLANWNERRLSDGIKHSQKFNAEYDWNIGVGVQQADGQAQILTNSDIYLRKYEEQRIRCLEIDEMERDFSGSGSNLTFAEYKRFVRDVEKYKSSQVNEDEQDICYIDFSDMIDIASRVEPSGMGMHWNYIFIDEAQDATKLMWRFFNNFLFYKCDNLWVSGDDDQCIYTFQGASPDRFINFKRDLEQKIHYSGEPVDMRINATSRRCYAEIMKLANAVISQTKIRIPKDMKSDKGKGGVFRRPQRLKDIIFHKGQKYLILGRHQKVLKGLDNIEQLFLKQRVSFRHGHRDNRGKLARFIDAHRNLMILLTAPTAECVGVRDIKEICKFSSVYGVEWFKKNKERLKTASNKGFNKLNNEVVGFDTKYNVWQILDLANPEFYYYMNHAIDRGESFEFGKESVLIHTIHSVKGMEEDNVILLTDIPEVIFRANSDAENSVWFVGITRAKKSLYITKRWLKSDRRFHADI